jgi:hypothetical protein
MRSITKCRHGFLLPALLACLVASLAGKALGAGADIAVAPVDFGSHVLVFNPSMSMAAIQDKINAVYALQQNNQFGNARYALLFKPGVYNVDIPVGYYTQVLGLGQNPDDTTITGYMDVWDSSDGNALDNFWRGAENLRVDASDAGNFDMFAVSQASPLRRMHFACYLGLSDFSGFSSGGFMADSLIDDGVGSWSQQQWMSRNNQYPSWSNGVWNQVFVGDIGAPSQGFPNPPYTTIAQTPVIREKPFLTFTSGHWGVFVPALRANSTGPSWASGAVSAGTTLPISRFYIAHSNADTAESINSALAAGKNLLLTPGVYKLDEPIAVTNPDTIVLGLGIATLKPEHGAVAMTVADVDGVDVSGILFDAGLTKSPVLLEVGPEGSDVDHSADPISLHDDFFRVGGAAVGKCATCLEINSEDVIGDDFWIWRADHGAGVGWTVNKAEHGLVVNGANFTMYGLACEHFEKYQTVWNANGGQLYFYQSEAPYDVPSDADWMDGDTEGYASYKVADTVTSHEAYGLGIYCYFDVNPNVALANAIEAPSAAGVQFNDMVTVSLGGVGTIDNIIDGVGGEADDANQQQYLVSYP